MRFSLLKISTLLCFLAIYSFAFAQKKPLKKVQFGKGISYMAKDSSFKVKFNFRMQNLFVVNYDQASDAFSSQFLVRRSRIKFDGFAFSPKLQYKAELGLSNRDISVNREDGNTRGAARIILDAVLKWKFSKNWALWAGQTKLPGNRERLISSANLQFVDRSLVNSRFNIDRDMGLQLRGKLKAGKMLILPAFAFSQGEGRNITSNNFGGFDYTARVEFLPFGKFASKGDYISSDLEREQSPKLVLAVAYDYNDGAVRQGGQLGSFVEDETGQYVENSLSTVLADLMFKYKGFSILSEFAHKTAAEQIDSTSHKFLTGSGFTAQAGYLFDKNVELAFRYTNVRKDNDYSGVSDENQYTLGVSKYVVGHSLKVQSDLTLRDFPSDNSSDKKMQFRLQVEMQF